LLIDRQTDRRLTVEQAGGVLVFGAQLDATEGLPVDFAAVAGHVAKVDRFATRIAAEHDPAKLRGLRQPSLGR